MHRQKGGGKIINKSDPDLAVDNIEDNFYFIICYSELHELEKKFFFFFSPLINNRCFTFIPATPLDSKIFLRVILFNSIVILNEFGN